MSSLGQIIPLHLPPGDTSLERTVQIDGTSEQIESAKQLVNEVISEVHVDGLLALCFNLVCLLLLWQINSVLLFVCAKHFLGVFLLLKFRKYFYVYQN